MIIKKYRPAFFEGFEEKVYEVHSKEELMTCELIKDWSFLGEICFDYSEDWASHIMAVIEKSDTDNGCEWWVVSIVSDKNDAKILRSWLPDWKEVISKYKRK